MGLLQIFAPSSTVQLKNKTKQNKRKFFSLFMSWSFFYSECSINLCSGLGQLNTHMHTHKINSTLKMNNKLDMHMRWPTSLTPICTLQSTGSHCKRNHKGISICVRKAPFIALHHQNHKYHISFAEKVGINTPHLYEMNPLLHFFHVLAALTLKFKEEPFTTAVITLGFKNLCGESGSWKLVCGESGAWKLVSHCDWSDTVLYILLLELC